MESDRIKHPMNKPAYLDALGRAMAGLPPDVQAKTLAYYEQRFVDGASAGRAEPDVARELDDPSKIAMTLRASIHLQAVQDRAATPGTKRSDARHVIRRSGGLLRIAFSGAALAVFNLFMLIPALVYSALLFALTVCALVFYLAGVATTASGLAGVNEVVLDRPALVADDSGAQGQVRIDIGATGIQVTTDGDDEGAAPDAKTDGLPERRHGRANTVRITTGMDAESRTTQTVFGIGMILGGTLLFLLSLAAGRASWIGLTRYLQMNRALLRGRDHA